MSALSHIKGASLRSCSAALAMRRSVTLSHELFAVLSH